MEKLSVKEFAEKIRDKRDLYEAVHRNGYYLPARKASIITEAYLINVLEGSTYCPRMEDIRLRACPRPPQKDILTAKFLELMTAKGIKSHGLDEKHTPDKAWLLDVLATLKPEDEIFRKNYLPPPKKKMIEEQKTIKVPRDFFTDLPESKSKGKRKALKIIGEGAVRQRIQYMKMSMKDLSNAIIIAEEKAEKLKASTKALGTDSGHRQNNSGMFKSPDRSTQRVTVSAVSSKRNSMNLQQPQSNLSGGNFTMQNQ